MDLCMHTYLSFAYALFVKVWISSSELVHAIWSQAQVLQKDSTNLRQLHQYSQNSCSSTSTLHVLQNDLLCAVLQTPNTFGSGMWKYIRIIVLTLHAYGIIAKSFRVNELDYASSLLQSTELTANSSVHRFGTVAILCNYTPLFTCMQTFICRHQWY